MIEGIDKRIVVVGGGPAGLYCAFLLKKLNPNVIVTVFEEHDECGKPVCCSGLIDVSGYDRLKLKNYLVLKEFLINKVYGAHIIGPLESNIDVLAKDVKAYVIDRVKFDKSIETLARNIGVEILNGNRVVSVNESFVKYIEKDTSQEKEMRFDFLIGADGPNSFIRDTFFKDFVKKDFIHTYQVEVEGSFDKNSVSVYLGDFAQNFFAWVVPESFLKAKIGIGVPLGKNPKKMFYKFKEKHKIKYTNVNSECSGILPILKPIKNLVYKNILLVGDAACFVKPTTGGGVNFGLMSSEIAAKTINERIKEYKDLTNYNKYLKPYRKELNLHYKLKNYFYSKDVFEQDKLLIKIKEAKFSEILEEHGNMDFPSLFLNKILINKNALKLFPEWVKFLIK